MKRKLPPLLGLLLGLALPAAAQHAELTGSAGVGLLQFGGTDAVSTSAINYANANGQNDGYTNSPYGSRLGAGLSLGLRAQRVGRADGLLAFDLGYDWLRSRTAISALNYYNGLSNVAYAATGTTSLQTQNLTAFVGLGHRLELGSVNLDLLAGPELAYVFSIREKGSGTYNGDTPWATNESRAFNRWDARLRADATVWCHQFGFNVSYSYGFLNYQSGLTGANREVYSRILRLGLTYRLR